MRSWGAVSLALVASAVGLAGIAVILMSQKTSGLAISGALFGILGGQIGIMALVAGRITGAGLRWYSWLFALASPIAPGLAAGLFTIATAEPYPAIAVRAFAFGWLASFAYGEALLSLVGRSLMMEVRPYEGRA